MWWMSIGIRALGMEVEQGWEDGRVGCWCCCCCCGTDVIWEIVLVLGVMEWANMGSPVLILKWCMVMVIAVFGSQGDCQTYCVPMMWLVPVPRVTGMGFCWVKISVPVPIPWGKPVWNLWVYPYPCNTLSMEWYIRNEVNTEDNNIGVSDNKVYSAKTWWKQCGWR